MRKVLLLLVLVIGLQTANAQYVSIPDSNFRMALKAKFPACFDSNDRMDTTCSGILNAVSLNVNNKSVSSIQGIQYFKKLFVLNCDSNNITTIPHINDTLYGLFCSHNRITSISTLPRNLKDLDCSYNQLTALPAIDKVSNSLDCSNNPSLSCLPTLFPSVFQGIKIRNTAITCFPNAFGGDADTTLPFCNSPCAFIEINTVTIPDSNFRLALKLKFPTCFNIYDRMDTTCADIINEDTLVVSGKNISSIEGVQYFKKLRRLDCKNNNLTTMPVLSDSLSYLECDNNKLVNLPQFSNQLNVLTCINNLLTYLPVFKPKNSFYQLSCDRNRLITLPVLPFSSMFYLSCSDNQLTSLPSLPNFLYAFNCTNNLLSCLPLLPSGLNGLNIKNNNITCLPNATTARVDTILPICTNLNSICEVNPFVQGKIYNDLNNNGVFNNGEELLAEQIVKVSPNNWLGASDVNGTYLVKLDTAINNTWSAINNFRYATITPTSYSLANIHNLGLQSGSYDFGVHLIPNIKDLETTLGSSPARPGFTTNVSVTANNVGTVNQSSITIKLKKPTDFSVLSTSILPTSIINDTLIWKNISINYLAHQSINIQLQVPVNATLGDSAVYEAWSNGTEGDTTPIDNYAKWTETIRGSFDPNDKLVNKETLSPTYNAEKDRLLYTIRFQNTGTDTAFTVIVRDEIPTNLEVSSLRVVNASHHYQLIVREKNIVEVAFPNIQLPDSNINEAKSHGFVQLEFKPKAGLPINAEINNNASIFFDYNSPVITNTATTRVQITTGIADNKKLAFKLFPNPSSEKITVELPYAGNGKWLLIDISGKIIKQSNIENITKSFDINVNDIESGTYLLSIESNDNLSSSKIVIFR